MNEPLGRRTFLKKSLAATVAAPFVISVEEHRLVQAAPAEPVSTPRAPAALCKRWHGTIGKVKISRLICGGNLISGYAHSRDLIYVSNLLKHYFTDEKIMATWALCEQHGIDTMMFNPKDKHAVEAYCISTAARAGVSSTWPRLSAKPEDIQDRRQTGRG